MTKPSALCEILRISQDISFYLQTSFEGFANIARSSLGRELVKAERKVLYSEYVSACNRLNLLVPKNQTELPFKFKQGCLWTHYAGSINKFRGDIIVAGLCGDKPTLKLIKWYESQFVGMELHIKRREETGYHYGKLMGEGVHEAKAAILAELDANRNTKPFADTFSFGKEARKLKELLTTKDKKKRISHPEYNKRLAELKNKRRALELAAKQVRYMERNLTPSGVRVASNAAGLEPKKVGGPRYRADDYVIDTETWEYVNPPRVPLWREIQEQKSS